MLEINSNDKIEKFVKKYIGITKYSYHQINIFIKLFISQYNKFKTKLKFLSNGKDVTKECIEEFAKCTQYFTNGGFAKLLTGIDGENYNEKKDYIDKLSEIYDNDLKEMEFPDPLIFIIKEKMIYDELLIPTKESYEYKNSKDYLKRIKEILNLPNEVEEDKGEQKSLLSIIEEKNNNYVITNDNFKKMVLLVYRIKANVPVIIMGDTGCGKTTLITKLNQILNNGKTTVEIINIHPGITDEK
jgi:ABC-type multidrug transport system fused ATPase/permease subunit